MTIQTPEEVTPAEPEMEEIISEQVKDERKRRWLLALLILLLLLICCVGILFYRYITRPQPIPEILPEPIAEQIYYPPTFKFAITGIEQPLGVGVSPDGQRIYTTETSGERLIKMYDRDGNLILSFAPPGTTSSNRVPAYIAVDANGRVFVSDNYNNVINIFDADGKFIDSIIGRDMTLSKFVTRETGSPPPPGTEFFYDNINKVVVYQLPDEEMQVAHAPENEGWLPLGLRFDPAGNLLVTNLEGGKHGVVVIPAESLNGPLTEYAPQLKEFGVQGDGDGELSFPNSAVTSSLGNFYVSDGNNSRVSVWSPDMQYQSVIGKGTADSALSLPRGLWMSGKDHLHIVDTVGQMVKVFDVSGAEPVFLYSFGEFGNEQGQFNFPSDIYIDDTGRVYITDRENGQVQIWSY
jgi:DNA-binding beta-propeller fold protein YncE